MILVVFHSIGDFGNEKYSRNISILQVLAIVDPSAIPLDSAELETPHQMVLKVTALGLGRYWVRARVRPCGMCVDLF
jgi:hypothetical protein